MKNVFNIYMKHTNKWVNWKPKLRNKTISNIAKVPHLPPRPPRYLNQSPEWLFFPYFFNNLIIKMCYSETIYKYYSSINFVNVYNI